MLKRGWEQSGVRAQFPKTFNATKNRSMMITICRDKDLAKAELMAALMCHSLRHKPMRSNKGQGKGQRLFILQPLLQERLLNNRRQSGGHPSLLLSHLKVLTRKNAEAGNDEGDHCSSPIDDTGNDDM